MPILGPKLKRVAAARGQGLSIGLERAELPTLFERGSIMHLRVILSGFIVLAFVAEATAQGRSRWRPGSILGELRSRVLEARQDRVEQEPTLAPVEGAADRLVDDVYRNVSPQPVRIYPAEPSLSPAPRPPQPIGQPQVIGQRQQQGIRAVTVDDVIELVRRGLGESTIVRYIGDNGVRQHLEVTDLIRLHEEGAAEPIIQAMQTAKVFTAAPSRNTRLLHADGDPYNSDPRFPEPPRQPVNVDRAVNADGFGPSILEPPTRPVMKTPFGNGVSAE
jgi:hypothetical protein